MKVDTEYLRRNHFWFLLAVYTPLLLLAMALLWTSVAGAIDRRATDINSLKDRIKQVDKPDIKNEAWINGYQGVADELKRQKNKVWRDVWNTQAPLFVWPQPVASLNALDYGEPIEENVIRDIYINDKNCYQKQLREMIDIVQPVNARGEGVVQFRGDPNESIRHVSAWLGDGPLVVPSSEEIWLAQEDLWVQREMLSMVRAANDRSAVYRKVPNPPALAAGELDHQVFTNDRFRLDIVVAKNKIRWRFTNLTSLQLTLGMKYQMTLRPAKTRELLVDGEPLGPFETTKEGTIPVDGSIEGVEGLVQLLDWRSAPVKRIDRLLLEAPAHRMTRWKLVPLRRFPKEPPPGSLSEGQPERYRYVSSTEQVRRMPIGLVLIIDQSNIQDVLMAIASSRLRVQITQVEWVRFRGSIQPAVAAPTATTAARPVATTPSEAMVSEEKSNLVELAVYGIASLYHRYPQEPAKAPERGNTPVRESRAASAGTPARD